MKNLKWTVVIPLLLVLALALVGGMMYSSFKSGSQSSDSSATSTDSSIPSDEPGVSCHDTPLYYVVQKQKADSVGTDILVKYKKSEEEEVACSYKVGQGDYEIANGDGAQYLYAITNNFLITDNGTAPDPRGLVVFDLNKRKEIFTDQYSKPLNVDGTTVTYWATSKKTPTAENCPDLASYQSNGLTAAIETEVSVEISTLTKKDLGKERCAARQ